jgi:ribonuclease HII
VSRPTPLDWDLANLSRYGVWCGVDEAGRGAWAGPVVAAAAALDAATAEKWRSVLRQARDSKAMKKERRDAMAMELRSLLPFWSVAGVDSGAIDRVNILEATKAAMRQAIAGLGAEPRLVLVDGDHAPGSGLREMTMVEGDAHSCAVACASILAKGHRDALMAALAREYPEYGFDRHKGYGTKEHRAALAAHGPCPLHRMSYAPVRACHSLAGGLAALASPGPPAPAPVGQSPPSAPDPRGKQKCGAERRIQIH